MRNNTINGSTFRPLSTDGTVYEVSLTWQDQKRRAVINTDREHCEIAAFETQMLQARRGQPEYWRAGPVPDALKHRITLHWQQFYFARVAELMRL